MSLRATVVSLAILAAGLSFASGASAQGFGIGPRMSFVRSDGPAGAPSARFFGGTIRMGTSKRVVIEVAGDYRSQLSEDGATRLRERPIQGSLLLFPVRSRLAPYLLAGYGMYSQTTETLDLTGAPIASVSERTTGAHAGFGAELFVSRHAAFFADYRFRFVGWGEPDAGDDPLNIPGASIIPGLDKVKLSHRGSMWTSGIAFYF